jgi:hypothetical protein
MTDLRGPRERERQRERERSETIALPFFDNIKLTYPKPVLSYRG